MSPIWIHNAKEDRGQSLIQGYASTRRVVIDGVELDPAPSLKIFNHSPDGFNWGYGGSGPSQLALALLLHYTDERWARGHYQSFKFNVIARLPQGGDFDMPARRVTDWIVNVREGSRV